MAQKPSIPKGTRDFLPEVMLRREHIFNTIRKVFRKYGYVPIETPAMEQLSVLTGKYGEEGDKLIFKILNNGDFLRKAKSLDNAQKLSFEISEKALRYDLTVPFARFVVMNHNELTFPFKRYQIQPVWRGDRPGKGRYREFYQCDADVVGSDSLMYEAEFVAIYDEVLSTLGLPGFSILLNNRKILSGYAELAGQPDKVGDICISIDKLDKIGEDGVRGELANRGISESAADDIFQLISFEGTNEEKLAFLEEKFANCEVGKLGVAEMREVLDTHRHFSTFNGTVTFDLTLARGLDYYTGTIFEVKAHDVAIGSICGGGRYADLTGVFGMKGLSGVGISFGAARIYDVMNELGLFGQLEESASKVMLVNFGDETRETCLKVVNHLRGAGISAELYPTAAKMKKQFGYADKKQIPYTLMIGTEEMNSGAYKLKNMQSGDQSSHTLEELVDLLK
ncbi:histidine--tRNA ligase [Pontibacter sp. G13]|uniref:histidine--tRNA ligase n=1 Tax=Pontibacter sp. G13 TaxID=3074898 RepID=UPI0028898D4C|nr:histidine--tRNA ligase [Pontibacter sp. G13]WNJ17588.1 histidine--tRNA ligase [Pontibacter sp. G13]